MTLFQRACVLCVLMLPSPAWAANYLVDPIRGDDLNSCSGAIEANTPDHENDLLASITKGIECAEAAGAGNTVTLLHGTYTGSLNVIDSAVTAMTSGASGAPLTIQAWRGHVATIQPPDGSPAVALRGSTDYIALLHLTIDMSLQTTAAHCGVLIDDTASNNNLERVEVKNNLGNGVCLHGGTGNTLKNQNYIHDNDGTGIHVAAADNFVQDSIVALNGDYGIFSSGATNTIRRNHIYGNNVDGGTTYGLVCSTGNDCINNVVYENRGGVQAMGSGAHIEHNTIYGNTPGIGLRIEAGATTARVRCNIVQSNSSGVSDGGGSTTLTDNVTSGVTFTSTASDDYSLADGSTAIGGCSVTVAAATTDILHHPRALGTADVGAYEASPGCPAGVCEVASGDVAGLRLALYTAKCGETIELADGGVWTVTDTQPFIIPTKGLNCTSYTTITRSGALPSAYAVLENCYEQGPNFLAEMAVRDACFAALQAAYETNAPNIDMTTAQANTNTGYVFMLEFDADYWQFLGFEVSTSSTNVWGAGSPVYGLFLSGLGGPFNADFPATEAQVPHHLVWDRMSLHGNTDPTIGPISKALNIQANNVELKNSLCYAIKLENDSQCFYTDYGSGFLIENNYLEANGEVVLFGGSGPFFRNHIPNTIVQRWNYMTKDYRQWANAVNVGMTYGGQEWKHKNVNECKNCDGNEIYQNVFEGSFDGEQGGPIMLYQSVSNGEGCYWCTVKNIELWGNVIRHGMIGVDVAGKGGQSGGSSQASNVHVHDNLFYGLNGLWSTSGVLANAGTCGRFFSNFSLGATHDPFDGIVWDSNTCDNESVPFILLTSSDADGFRNLTYTNNIARAKDLFTAMQGACSCNGIGDGMLTFFDTTDSWVVNHNVWAHVETEWAFPAQAEPAWFEHGADAAATLVLYKAIFVDRDGGDYTVAPGSLYKAGGARNASDGEDLGADMSLLPDGVIGGGGETQGRSPRARVRVR